MEEFGECRPVEMQLAEKKERHGRGGREEGKKGGKSKYIQQLPA